MKQLIKAAVTYKAELPSTDALALHLAEAPFVECQPHEIRSHGFVPVVEDKLAVEFPGGVAFGARIDTKVIPASEISKETVKLTKRWIDMEGRKPNKSERAELKDAAILSLAKTAFVKTALIRCYYHRASGYLIIPTTSQKLCDTITTMLVHAVGSVKTETIHVSNVKGGLTTRLKQWLADQAAGELDSSAFGGFEPCSEVALAQDKRKITIKMGSLQPASSALNEALAGAFEVMSMGFTHQGLTDFRLTHDFKLKGIEFAHPPTEEDDVFAAEAALEVAAVVGIIDDLCELLKYQEGDTPEEEAAETAHS